MDIYTFRMAMLIKFIIYEQILLFMTNILVIIGHHTEEILFGEAVRNFMENTDISFYKVKNGYPNGSSGYLASKAEINGAENEIYNEMFLRNPRITIDIHTSEGRNAMCLSQIIATHEFERLLKIQTANHLYPVDNSMSVHIEKFEPIIRDSMLQNQAKFPYVTLEMFLENDLNKLSYISQVEFAVKVIKDISNIYS
jgi:hypothetical protein